MEYIYSFDNDNYTCGEKYPTKKAALAAALEVLEDVKNHPEYMQTMVFVGKAVNVGIPTINVNSVIDNLIDEALETSEYAEKYLEDVTAEQQKELEQLLNKAFAKWSKKHNLLPDWYLVEEIAYEANEFV